jgi:hypothetical protein
MRPLVISLTISALSVVGFTNRATASTIVFDNLAPGDGYDGTTWSVGMPPFNPNWEVATSFVPEMTVTLDEIVAPFIDFGPIFGWPASELDLSITSSDGLGMPGAVLESFHYAGPFGGLTTFDSILSPTLFAGVQYWLVATNPNGPSGAVLGWAWNSTGDTSATAGATRQGESGIFYELRDPDVAFRVTGDVVSVPEPSTLTLLAGGLSALQARSWLNRRRRS